MSLVLDLPESTLRTITERAAAIECPPEALVCEIVRTWVWNLNVRTKTSDQDELTDEEACIFVRKVRQEIWEEKQRADATPSAVIESNGTCIPPPSET